MKLNISSYLYPSLAFSSYLQLSLAISSCYLQFSPAILLDYDRPSSIAPYLSSFSLVSLQSLSSLSLVSLQPHFSLVSLSCLYSLVRHRDCKPFQACLFLPKTKNDINDILLKLIAVSTLAKALLFQCHYKLAKLMIKTFLFFNILILGRKLKKDTDVK